MSQELLKCNQLTEGAAAAAYRQHHRARLISSMRAPHHAMYRRLQNQQRQNQQLLGTLLQRPPCHPLCHMHGAPQQAAADGPNAAP